MTKTYLDCFVEDLQSQKLGHGVARLHQDFIDGEPRILALLELVENLIGCRHLQTQSTQVGQYTYISRVVRVHGLNDLVKQLHFVVIERC